MALERVEQLKLDGIMWSESTSLELTIFELDTPAYILVLNSSALLRLVTRLWY